MTVPPGFSPLDLLSARDAALVALCPPEAELVEVVSTNALVELMHTEARGAGVHDLSPAEAATLAEIAIGEARAASLGGVPPRTLAHVDPEETARAEESARVACLELPVVESEFAALARARDELGDVDAAPSPTSRVARQFPLVAAAIVIIVIDAANLVAAFASALGLDVFLAADTPTPPTIWFAALGGAASVLAVGLAAGEGVVRWYGRKFSSVVGIPSALALLAIAVGTTVLRGNVVGGNATGIVIAALGGLTSFALPVLFAVVIRVGAENKDEAVRRSGRTAASIGALEEAMRRIRDDQRARVAAIARPALRRSLYAALVTSNANALQVGAVEAKGRVVVAVLVRRWLAGLPAKVRELHLRERAARAAVIAIAFAGLCASACDAAAPAPLIVVEVCDGTGPGGPDACVLDALRARARAWATRAFTRPRSQFIVIATADRLENTHVSLRMTSPATLNGDLVTQRGAFFASVDEQVTRVEVPRDVLGTKPTNKSNGFAALMLATRLASEFDGDLSLELLTDGQFVAPAVMNAEVCIPGVDDVLKRLRHEGYSIDLRRFKRVAICGLSVAGITSPLRVSARDAFIVDFLGAVGAPKPITTRSSCLPGAAGATSTTGAP